MDASTPEHVSYQLTPYRVKTKPSLFRVNGYSETVQTVHFVCLVVFVALPHRHVGPLREEDTAVRLVAVPELAKRPINPRRARFASLSCRRKGLLGHVSRVIKKEEDENRQRQR